MLPPILEEIQTYTRAVEAKEVRCDLPWCPRCGDTAASFKLHDRRKRTYYVIVERLVRTVLSLLTRWKCSSCGDTFTLYPEFALARKRYVRQAITELSARYLSVDRESYRRVVRVEQMAVFHQDVGGESDDDNGTIDERVFSHTTLYRWMAFLSLLERTRRNALRLIRARSPSSEVFRRIVPIVPRKYRSPGRKTVLRHALDLLVAEGEYQAVFSLSIFPRLATLCAWG